MKFWKINSPDYDDDYRAFYVNGTLEHPFSMPGVICRACGNTWGGHRHLPITCPEDLRLMPKIKASWPVSTEEFKKICKDVISSLNKAGYSGFILRPGDIFLQPSYLDIPSLPCADFLWCSIGTLVVSDRIKFILSEFCSEAIAFGQVTPRTVGKLKSDQPPQLPSTGEPEDIIKEIPHSENMRNVNLYHEVCILKEANYPNGVLPEEICSICGRQEILTGSIDFKMKQDMWPGSHIFFFPGTAYIIVTDFLKNKIEEIKPINVNFSPM